MITTPIISSAAINAVVFKSHHLIEIIVSNLLKEEFTNHVYKRITTHRRNTCNFGNKSCSQPFRPLDWLHINPTGNDF